MIVGIDFDNTIVDYTGVFFQVARQQDLIPDSVGTSKEAVKSYLIEDGRERDWTILQGEVYGKHIHLAKIYPGITELLVFLEKRNIPYYIVSHKTKHPVIGEAYDLHAFAISFLESIFAQFTITKDHVYFEPTMEAKSHRIKTLQCTHFIDDLEKFLQHPSFPESCCKVHFSPDTPSGLHISFSNHIEILHFLQEQYG